MKLEVGKYYLTRDGRKVGPLKENQEHGPWFFFTGNRKDDTFRAYGSDGEFCGDEYPTKLEPDGDIISEWTDTPEVGPVRTVTTTRQEIVPGVYGCVEVYDDGDQVGVTMDCGLDVIDLTAAIQTLTAIRDAMQANTTA